MLEIVFLILKGFNATAPQHEYKYLEKKQNYTNKHINMNNFTKYKLWILASIFTTTIYSQNLVRNGDFENLDGAYRCVGGGSPRTGQYQLAKYWYNASYLTGIFGSSSDLSCDFMLNLGYPPGVEYIGIAAGESRNLWDKKPFSEAIFTTLTDTLTLGDSITISFDITHTSKSTSLSDTAIPFGLFFFSSKLKERGVGALQHLADIPQVIIPSDSIIRGWKRINVNYVITDTFVNKVAIGYFNPDSLIMKSKYITLDNVSIKYNCPSEPSFKNRDTSINFGDSAIFPKGICEKGKLKWYENSLGIGNYYSSTSIIPSKTTTYYPFCYLKCLSPVGSPFKVNIKDCIQGIHPNPNNGNFTVFLCKEIKEIELKIIDATGKIIMISNFEQSSKIIVDFEGANGIYFVEVNIRGERAIYKMIKVD